MIEGRRVLAVVPARGGSKGVPLKNLREVGGASLVAHAARVASRVPDIDRAVVSTDHPRIVEAAVAAGLPAPFLRPPELSGDRIGDVDVLVHALLEMERQDGLRYDIVVMLQPTSPLRGPADVQATLRELVAGAFDSVWTLSEVPLSFHPKKQLERTGEGLAYCHEEGQSVIARQELEPTYVRNGVCYALTRGCLLEQRRLLGARAGCVVLPGPWVSIDSEEDLAKVDALLRAAQSSSPPESP